MEFAFARTRLRFGAIDETVFAEMCDEVIESREFALSFSSKFMFLSSSIMRFRYSSVDCVACWTGATTEVTAAAAAAMTRLRFRSSSARLICTSFSRCERRSVSARSRSCAYADSMSS